MKSERNADVITRREAREYAMQVLYAYELSQEPIEMLMETIAAAEMNTAPEHLSFTRNLVYAVLNHRQELDTIIIEHARNWEFDRLAVIDKILLRLGITEFLYFPDIPPKVTMNECVEIAKKFSTEKSGHFINGLLDTIQHVLLERGRMQKAGRGLIDR